MEIIQNNQKTAATASQSDTAFNVQDILQQCIAHWWWFVVSLIVVMGAALYYIWSTPPVYTRSASILLKEDGKSGSGGGVDAAFSDMGLFSVKTNVNNEIFSMKSPAVMLDVVKRLHLDVDYKIDGTFYKKTLYGTTLPLSVGFLELDDNETAALTVALGADSTLTLKNFVRNGEEIAGEASCAYGDTIDTPLGRLAVARSAYYDSSNVAASPVKEILVTRSSLNGAVAAYSAGLSVAGASRRAMARRVSIWRRAACSPRPMRESIASCSTFVWAVE